MATHKKPFHTLRSGGMKAAIWLNDGIKGPFFSTTFSFVQGPYRGLVQRRLL